MIALAFCSTGLIENRYISANVSETDQVELMFASGLGEMYPVELCLHNYRTLSCILMRALGRASDTCMEAFFFMLPRRLDFATGFAKPPEVFPLFQILKTTVFFLQPR